MNNLIESKINTIWSQTNQTVYERLHLITDSTFWSVRKHHIIYCLANQKFYDIEKLFLNMRGRSKIKLINKNG